MRETLERSLMSKHFMFKIVDAGEWRREAWQEEAIAENGSEVPANVGSSDESRPHIIPITEMGKKLAIVDGMCGSFGLPIGLVLVGGEWIHAFRFITIEEETAVAMMKDMDAQVERFQALAV